MTDIKIDAKNVRAVDSEEAREAMRHPTVEYPVRGDVYTVDNNGNCILEQKNVILSEKPFPIGIALSKPIVEE